MMDATPYCVVLVTTSNEEEAESIGRSLVEHNLAACANLVPGVRSIYRWNGEICDDSEVLLIIKTQRNKVEPLTSAVQELHSYDNPEVVALPIIGGSTAYLEWIRQIVEGGQS